MYAEKILLYFYAEIIQKDKLLLAETALLRQEIQKLDYFK